VTDLVDTPSEATDAPNSGEKQEWYASRGITSPRIIKAIEAVPREGFLELAGTESLPAHSIPSIEVVGKLLEALEVGEGAKILEIGTDAGYISAILGHLAGQVYTVERRLPVAKLAEGRLRSLAVENVEILHGPRLTAYVHNAPYNGILLSAVTARVPEKLKSRLAIGGRLVVPVGQGDKNPEVVCVTRTGEDSFEEKSYGQLRFSALLGDILVEMGVAQREDIEIAALEADAKGKRLGQTLLESARIKEADLIRALAIQRGFQLAPVDTLLKLADHELAYSVPRAFLKHHRILPLLVTDGKLKVATVDPDAPAVELATLLDATSVESYLVTTLDFDRLWVHLLEGRRGTHGQEENLKSRVESKLETLLRSAVRVQASMIHLDNDLGSVRVRYRIAGKLRPMPELALETAEYAYLVEFLKMGAKLDMMESQLPQRGRYAWIRDGVTYHLQVQLTPSIMGEQLTLQILTKGQEPATLAELGFPKQMIDELKVLLEMRHGLFLIVGPRHVGKTATQYALLHHLAQDGSKKIVSIEEDIVSPIPGVQQTMIQSERGFGYSQALHEFARTDADVISVGEFNKPQLVLDALNIAHRGMIVLGTLQGKNALAALHGLRDFGIPVEFLASGITAIITQRLANKVCEHCRELDDPDPTLLESLFPNGAPMGFKTYRGKGCAHCNQSGLSGRVPIVEFLPISDALRRAIAADAPLSDLRKLALNSGVTTLPQYALKLCREGIIPVEELSAYLPVKAD
jgi:type IV pilus assembly protein PilB